MKFQLALLLGLACSVLATPVVDPKVFSTLETKGTVTVLISFKKANTERVLSTFRSLKTNFESRGARITTMYNLLKDHADSFQSDVLRFLEKTRATKSQMTVTQLWINGEVIVRKIDKETIVALQSMDEIEKIRADRLIPWHSPIVHPEAVTVQDVQWGVAQINAPACWAQKWDGTGVVVGHIDTGVRGTHDALKGNYRADNGWYDPEGGTTTPNDNNGHGTHTMGTICGQGIYGTGVAPGATWIACKGCGTDSCSGYALLTCGQFMCCPTDVNGNNPDCSKAPQVVSNSWGGGQGEDFYDSIINAWRAAGIIPLFSMGNSGSTCRTANSPGDSSNVIALGSSNSDNSCSSFSSRGPSVINNGIKPDMSAPGNRIGSCYSRSDSDYVYMSGTSMACPHAAGVVALLFQIKSNWSYDEIKTFLSDGANKNTLSGSQTCGNTADTVFPNNIFGNGIIDANNSVWLAKTKSLNMVHS